MIVKVKASTWRSNSWDVLVIQGRASFIILEGSTKERAESTKSSYICCSYLVYCFWSKVSLAARSGFGQNLQALTWCAFEHERSLRIPRLQAWGVSKIH
jgi:hypothetical protein